MNSLFTYANRDGVAVITVDNPPVKALSPGVPEGLDAARTALPPMPMSAQLW
jgi:enoyl-CoA hydratase/carnithine racemase